MRPECARSLPGWHWNGAGVAAGSQRDLVRDRSRGRERRMPEMRLPCARSASGVYPDGIGTVPGLRRALRPGSGPGRRMPEMRLPCARSVSGCNRTAPGPEPAPGRPGCGGLRWGRCIGVCPGWVRGGGCPRCVCIAPGLCPDGTGFAPGFGSGSGRGPEPGLRSGAVALRRGWSIVRGLDIQGGPWLFTRQQVFCDMPGVPGIKPWCERPQAAIVLHPPESRLPSSSCVAGRAGNG